MRERKPMWRKRNGQMGLFEMEGEMVLFDIVGVFYLVFHSCNIFPVLRESEWEGSVG